MNCSRGMKTALSCAVIATMFVSTPAFSSTIVLRGVSAGERGLRPARFRPAATTTTLFGGGATLPAFAYNGPAALSSNPATAPSSGSAFYFYSHFVQPSEKTSYCQTGSGFGKKVLDGVAASGANDANLPCPPLGVTAVTGTNGFGAVGQTVADFAGSDAPFAASEYASFVTDGAANSLNPIAGRIEPVQFPAIAGSIALFYKNDDPAVSNLTHLPLTDAQICGIATGTITNWKQLNPSFASKPLYFVSRYDGSGTSFNFTNHHASACGAPFGVNHDDDSQPSSLASPYIARCITAS